MLQILILFVQFQIEETKKMFHSGIKIQCDRKLSGTILNNGSGDQNKHPIMECVSGMAPSVDAFKQSFITHFTFSTAIKRANSNTHSMTRIVYLGSLYWPLFVFQILFQSPCIYQRHISKTHVCHFKNQFSYSCNYCGFL